MSRASDDAMDKLHEALAQQLTDAVVEGVPVKDDDTGEVHKAPASASILNVARQFLKDNDVKVDPSVSKRLTPLTEKLPFSQMDAHGLDEPSFN